MTTKEFFQSSGYNKLIIALGSLLAFLVIFAAGMAVGYREAAFSYHWQSNYGPGFSDPSSPFAPFIHDGDDVSPHGAFGTIVSFKSPYLMVKGDNQAESIIAIGSSTVIRHIRAFGTTTDLLPGQQVIIIGTPDNSGRIQASFIRVVPPPSTTTAPQQ